MSEQNDPRTDPDPDLPGTSPIGWRRLSPRLWAGRRDERPAGTIEQGSSFVFVDLQGDRHTGYRTLEDAKDAATGPIRLPLVNTSPSRARQRARLLLAVVVVVAVLAVVWAVLRFQPFS